MVQQVRVNGQIHQFPDEATPDQINEALGGAPNQPSIGQDISNLPQYAQAFAQSLPSEFAAATQQPLGRSLKNVAAGYLGLANIPHQVAEYYASRHIPGLEKLIEHYPWKADLDPNKYLGLGESQPGDLIFQSMGPGGLLKDAAKMVGGTAINAAKLIPGVASRAAEKAGDFAPIIKRIPVSSYKEQQQMLKSKDLLTGYKPNPNDVLKASEMLKSEGMKIPHAAIDIATGKALEGDFNPWFNLQSSVRSEGRRLSKKGGVHLELGQELHGLAEKMHQEMAAQQIARGAPEAAEKGEQAKQRMARYHKILPYRRMATGAAIASAAPGWIGKLIRSMEGS